MKKIAYFLIITGLFTSCQVSKNFIKTERYLPSLADNAPLYLYFQDEIIPDTSLFIGTIDLPAPQSILSAIYSIETDARDIGGNAVLITNYDSDFDHDYYIKPQARVYRVQNYDHIDIKISKNEENFKDKDNSIVGIYKIEDKYGKWSKYVCTKTSDTSLALVYYSSNDRWFKYQWKEGDVKARMKQSITKGIYNSVWYGENKSLHNNVKIKFNNNRIHALGPGVELYLDQIYPDSLKIKEDISMGTGFALNENGYNLTDYHVVKSGKKIFIKGINGNFDKEFEATLSSFDVDNDLAVLKLNDKSVKLANIPYNFNKNDSKIGENVYVLGYPMPETMGDNLKLTDGLVSSESGVLGDLSMYQITAPIQPGNSGCPLFNRNGEVIGLVNSKIYIIADNVAYAIKTKYWENMLPEFPTINYSDFNRKATNEKNISDQVNDYKNYIYLIEVKE